MCAACGRNRQRGGFLVYMFLRTQMLLEVLLAWGNGDRVWCEACVCIRHLRLVTQNNEGAALSLVN